MSIWRVKRANLLALLLLIGACSLLSRSSRIGPLFGSNKLYTFKLQLKALQPIPPNYSDIEKEYTPVLLKEVPARRFRDNLRNDTNYLTSWSNAGLTNQFMGYVNMIYISTLTDRIPIIPPFAPDHHISKSAGIVPFGDIFDLRSLRDQLQRPILEWRDVKELPVPRSSENSYATPEIEDIGCWTTRKEIAGEPIRAENLVRHLGVDASFTRVPVDTRFDPSAPEDDHVVIPKLTALVYPRNPSVATESLQALAPSPKGHWLKPDKHLTCFDTLYYATSGSRRFEWEYSWSPAWRMVGRHLLFTDAIKELGRSYLRRALKVTDPGDELPPFIAVHIRRGDFFVYGKNNGEDGDDPFPSLDAYNRHVTDIQNELKNQLNGLLVSHVIVMSDEVSHAFWDDVREKRWFYVDHAEEMTLERYGEWYLPLIDVAIQSFAVGFVGTEGSTYSLVSERRVEDWNGGIVRNVNLATRQ